MANKSNATKVFIVSILLYGGNNLELDHTCIVVGLLSLPLGTISSSHVDDCDNSTSPPQQSRHVLLSRLCKLKPY